VQEINSVGNIYRQPIEGGEPAPITHFKEGRISGSDWSHDGARLRIRREIESVPNLWVAPPRGGEPVQVTDFKTGQIFGVTWGPGARGLFFTYGHVIQYVVLIRDFR